MHLPMFVSSSALTVRVADDGPRAGATPVLLLHQLAGSLNVWEAPSRALARSRRVIRPDMRGHGLTDVTAGPYAIEQLADDALGVLDALGVAGVHVVGLSIGGMVAQAMAHRARERVQSLTLVATGMALPPAALWRERAARVRAEGVGGLVDGTMGRWVSTEYAASPAGRGLRTTIVRTPVEGYAGCCEAIAAADLHETTRALRLPALVMVGTKDVGTPPAMAEALAGAIPGARLLQLEGAAHIPLAEHGAAVTEALESFLEGAP
jgi:3-oxoadipate enol-lactonase